MYTFKTIKKQDWRYDYLKEKSGVFYPLINLFGIHLIPTFFVFAALLPVLVMFLRHPVFHPLMIVGAIVSLFGVALELVADIQMHRFRRTNQDRKAIIRVGLWQYARHPNTWGNHVLVGLVLDGHRHDAHPVVPRFWADRHDLDVSRHLDSLGRKALGPD
jgi:steroid 5-alpha reductase family enzyme